MHFGKTYEACYAQLQVEGLPPFPYKIAKKRLKAVLHSEDAGARAAFVAFVDAETRRLDALWQRKCVASMRAYRSPRRAFVLRKVGAPRQQLAPTSRRRNPSLALSPLARLS